MKKNVLPVIKEQRAKLEKDISAEDKTQLSAFRIERKENRQIIKEGRKKKKESKKSDSELSQAEKEALWIAEGKQKDLISKVKGLAKTYKDEIKTLSDEIGTQRTTWENDLKAMREKHQPKVKKGKKGNKNK